MESRSIWRLAAMPAAIALMPCAVFRVASATDALEAQLRGGAQPFSTKVAKSLNATSAGEFGRWNLRDLQAAGVGSPETGASHAAAVAEATGLKAAAKDAPPAVAAVEEAAADNATNQTDEPRGVDVPACTINSFAAFFYLNQAAMSVAASVQDCSHEMEFGSETMRVCAADILGITQSFWNSGAYLSGLASQCAEVANVEAECAAIIMAWVGSLAEFFQAATSLAQTCGLVGKPGVAVEEVAQDVVRRRRRLDGAWLNESMHSATDTLLSPHPATSSEAAPSASERSLQALGINGMSVGWCYVNTGSAVTYLAQAGWLIELAAKDCEVTETEEQKQVCSADSSAIIGAFTNVVSYIGGAASLCSNTLDLRGLCTADVNTLLNALAGLAGTSSVLRKTCTLEDPLGGGQFSDDGSADAPPPTAPLKEGETVVAEKALLDKVSPGAKPEGVPSGKELVDEVVPGARFV